MSWVVVSEKDFSVETIFNWFQHLAGTQIQLIGSSQIYKQFLSTYYHLLVISGAVNEVDNVAHNGTDFNCLFS